VFRAILALFVRLAVLTCGTSRTSLAQSTPQTAEYIEELARQFIEDAPENPELFDELKSPDVMVYFAGSPQPARNIEEFKLIRSQPANAFPDSVATVDEILSEGDKVALRWTYRSTHTGDFQGLPPTNRNVEITAVDLLYFKAGKIVLEQTIYDQLSLFIQLGVMPASGPAATQAAAGSG
jgi:steroid delta-isomerase-like uncharacterized protein